MKIVRYIIFIIFLVLLIITGIWLLGKKSYKPVHYHAGFIVYIDGKKQDYFLPQYMHVEICNANKNSGPPTIISDKVHLHDNIGDIVHVHSNGVVWQDLFISMGVILPTNEKITGYNHGRQVNDILHQEIKPYDSVIIIFGGTKNINIKQGVTLQHIKDIEKRSESCN